MAIKFNNVKGEAQKSSINTFKYEDGENQIRLIGDVLARYVYWIKGENDKNIPLECLSFDRNLEKFTNIEKDWVREFYPDLNCGWSYAMQCIHDGEVKVINLKKKLWQQILELAGEDGFGDPTDTESGWDVVFTKKKTGPHAYNVEYTLKQIKCKTRPLNEEELELVSSLKSMDEVMPRPTPDAQKELLDRVRDGTKEADNVDEEALENEFRTT